MDEHPRYTARRQEKNLPAFCMLARHGQYASPVEQSEMFARAGLEVLSQTRRLGRHLLITVGRQP